VNWRVAGLREKSRVPLSGAAYEPTQRPASARPSSASTRASSRPSSAAGVFERLYACPTTAPKSLESPESAPPAGTAKPPESAAPAGTAKPPVSILRNSTLTNRPDAPPSRPRRMSTKAVEADAPSSVRRDLRVSRRQSAEHLALLDGEPSDTRRPSTFISPRSVRFGDAAIVGFEGPEQEMPLETIDQIRKMINDLGGGPPEAPPPEPVEKPLTWKTDMMDFLRGRHAANFKEEEDEMRVSLKKRYSVHVGITQDGNAVSREAEVVADLAPLAVELNMPVQHLLIARTVFEAFDSNGNGLLDKYELAAVVKDLMSMTNEKNNIPLLRYLQSEILEALHMTKIRTGLSEWGWKDFVTWYWKCFKRGIMMTGEQELEALACKHGLRTDSMTFLKRCFDASQEDDEDALDEERFERFMRKALKVPHTAELPAARVQHFWTELESSAECVGFKELIAWWVKVFGVPGSSHSVFNSNEAVHKGGNVDKHKGLIKEKEEPPFASFYGNIRRTGQRHHDPKAKAYEPAEAKVAEALPSWATLGDGKALWTKKLRAQVATIKMMKLDRKLTREEVSELNAEEERMRRAREERGQRRSHRHRGAVMDF